MVQTAGNQLLPIEGKDNVQLNSEAEININEVYFVPRLSFSLLSAGSIVDMEYTLVFDDKECTIYQDQKIISKGICDGQIGLYRYLVSQPDFSICAISSILIAQL